MHAVLALAGTLDPRGSFLRSDGTSDIGLELYKSTLRLWARIPNNVPLSQLNSSGAERSIMNFDASNSLNLAPDSGIPAVNIGWGGTAIAANGVPIPAFGTPSTSTNACVKGQIEVDASYIYICYDTNKWHRAAAGSW
jgi:hypothetical protein